MIWPTGVGWPTHPDCCPVCGVDHRRVEIGQGCPEHGHWLQNSHGELWCPARLCNFVIPLERTGRHAR